MEQAEGLGRVSRQREGGEDGKMVQGAYIISL